MSTKKLFLQIIGFTFTLWLLAGCGSTSPGPTLTPLPPTTAATAAPTPAPSPTATTLAEPIDFTGHWENESLNFSLDLSQDGMQVRGSHVVVAQQGNKIDSLDNSITGTIQGESATIHFQSSFSTNAGVAQITFIDPNTISWKVTSPPDGENYLPSEATLVKTMPVAAATIPANSGTITGRVHLVSPPTPRMIVYAVDQTTGLWASTETAATDGEAPYTLVVPPGAYQVFAFSADTDIPGIAGYATPDEATLAMVTVAAGQTVMDIIIRPPSQSECGSEWGLPPSPDGRFAAISPSPDCLATRVAKLNYVPVSPEICKTLQEIAAQALSITFTMEPSTPFTDPLSGVTGQGCTLTATGTGTNFPGPGQVTANLVSAFMGWTEQPVYQADGPTGAVTALTRDMGLMLISAEWTPAPDAKCPADQPISACDVKPEQKLYTIRIQAAQK